jgi:hypothetical protein
MDLVGNKAKPEAYAGEFPPAAPANQNGRSYAEVPKLLDMPIEPTTVVS